MMPNSANSDQSSLSTVASDMHALEARLEAAEMRLVFMDDTVEALNQIVIDQAQRLDQQEQQLRLLYQKLDSMASGEGVEPFSVLEDRPPHY